MKKFFLLETLLLSAVLSSAEFLHCQTVPTERFSPELAGKLRIRQAWNSPEACGDIYLITTPDNKITLVDCGWGYLENNPAKFYNTMLFPALEEQKIKHIDRVIITHPHGDHIGALPNLLRKTNISIGEVCWDPIAEELLQKHIPASIKLQADVINLCRERNIPLRELKANDVLSLGKDVTATILTVGYREAKSQKSSWLNDQSVVFQLKYGAFTMLFTGDCGFEEEDHLLKNCPPELLKSDVIKLAHHGGSGSTSERFLKRVSPRAAVASLPGWLAADKRGERVVKLMQKLQIPYYMSWQHPYLSIVSDGRTFEMININYPE